MSLFAAVDPDRLQISHRAASMGLVSDGHLADVFGMDMVQAATSPTGYTAAQAYYALDQSTEARDFMGARNVGSMSQEEAMGVFGAYVEGYREGLAIADTDTFAGIFSKGRVRRYKKQMERYNAARSANNQKKAAKSLGRMKALWGRMSESDREGLTSPDKMAVPGVEVAKAISPKAAKADKKISKDDDASTDAADAESSAEDAMGAAFGAAGAKAYKNRKAYIEAAIKGRAAGTLSLSALEPLFAAVKWKKGLPTPAQIVAGAEVSLDMVIPATTKGSSNDMYGADLEIDAEMNAEDAMGALFGADGVEQYKHRKAYVEAAMKAIAEGNLGKVNLVKLWKKVKGGKGLPSPSRIRAGAKVTADMAIPPTSMGADDQDYLNRKAYVEAAVNAVATGRLGKVNLVELWKLVKGRAGLPTPSEVKAGAPITLSMATPPASMGYDFGADGLPEDDSDIDAVLGATIKSKIEDEGESFVKGVRNSREVDVVKTRWDNLRKEWLSMSQKTRNGYQSRKRPSDYLKEAGAINMSLTKKATGLSENDISKGLTGFASMGYAFGADGLPEDDSDIDAVLGADDDDMDDLGADEGDDGLPEDDSDIDAVLGADDDDMDELGADDDEDMDDLGADDDDDDVMGVWVIKSPGSYRRQVKDLFQALRRNKSNKVEKNWKEINAIWDKLKPDERRQVKKPDAILREAGKENMQMMILVTGKTKEQIERVGKKKPAASAAPTSTQAEAMGYAFGADGLPDDDSDIDAVLGADDDDMDDFGADDDDMDDLGADEDDDDFGLDDIEMNIDLDMQRALVNRYSGADQPFPAGGAAPFPGPRMAGHEVF
jgi:hypothetical protein